MLGSGASKTRAMAMPLMTRALVAVIVLMIIHLAILTVRPVGSVY